MSVIQLSARLVGTGRALVPASLFLIAVASASQAQTAAPARTLGPEATVETRNKAIVKTAFEKWRTGGDVFAELLVLRGQIGDFLVLGISPAAGAKCKCAERDQ